jgi:hypothetical protein
MYTHIICDNINTKKVKPKLQGLEKHNDYLTQYFQRAQEAGEKGVHKNLELPMTMKTQIWWRRVWMS